MAKTLGYFVESLSGKPGLTDSQAAVPGILGDACPACGASEMCVLFAATDRLYATTSRVFQIVECGQCRLIRLHPQPTPQELRDYYPADYWVEPEATVTDRFQKFYRRMVLRDHLRFAERAIRESEAPGIVLDVGCGSGVFLKRLAEREEKSGRAGKIGRAEDGEGGRRKVVGLDFAVDAATATWRHSGVPAICATLSRAPFASSSCAAITMFHVLEHLYDPGSYLRAAHELLAPGGRLIVQVPNAASWQFLLFGERWKELEVPRHLVHFRRQDLEALLDHCGFEILRSKHFSLRDNPQGMAVSLAPRLDPTGRRLRRVPETPRMCLSKDLAFFALLAACLPFTLLEAACHAGSTVMIEARKK